MKLLVRHQILCLSILIASISIYLISHKSGIVLKFSDGSQTSVYEIAKLVSSVCGTILGFLLTAVAMLTAVMDRKLVDNMRKTGHYQIFITDCFMNCLLLLITTILGISVLFLSLPLLNCIFFTMLFFAICSIIFLIFLGRRFLLIFLFV